MTTSPPGKGANISQRTTSLASYAKENPQHHNGRCWMCNIPERDEANAAYASGVGAQTIAHWLVGECGHTEATYAKVHNHFQNRHHERTQ